MNNQLINFRKNEMQYEQPEFDKYIFVRTPLEIICHSHKELLEEFILTNEEDKHSEINFVRFLTKVKKYSEHDANTLWRIAVWSSALCESPLEPFVALDSTDTSCPVTTDLMDRTLFPALLLLEPSKAKYWVKSDCRQFEVNNFAVVAELIVSQSMLTEWVGDGNQKLLTNHQLKARRIWHKNAVLTWASYLKNIVLFALKAQTNEDRERLLYSPPITERQRQFIEECLIRLFLHSVWDDPEGKLDDLLSSTKRLENYFINKGLTERYVICGQA